MNGFSWDETCLVSDIRWAIKIVAMSIELSTTFTYCHQKSFNRKKSDTHRSNSRSHHRLLILSSVWHKMGHTKCGHVHCPSNCLPCLRIATKNHSFARSRTYSRSHHLLPIYSKNHIFIFHSKEKGGKLKIICIYA